MDLDIVRVIKAIPPEHEPLQLARLTTPFGDAIDEEHPHPEHPRPACARTAWSSLNGPWTCAFVSNRNAAHDWRTAEVPEEINQRIIVPFSPEATLSGVNRQLQPDELLWYRRSFTAPKLPADRSCLLHFDGVDYACAVYVNDLRVGDHMGAYQPFCLDITDALVAGDNELHVCVYDPSETGNQLRGKQRLDRGDMWYTAQSGIWKDVWLEVVPQAHLDDLYLNSDADAGKLRVTAWTKAPEGEMPALHVTVLDEGVEVARGGVQPAMGADVVAFSVSVSHPHLWSPEDPHLYQVRVVFGDDVVESYCAFRTIAISQVGSGLPRICLNHRPYFLRGLLDQGYWPDGLLTPPSDEAIIADITAAREAGFNLLRKHIKVETDRWYYHCDRLGMLVFQDMPSGGGELDAHYTRDLPTLWRRSWASKRDDTPEMHDQLAAGSATYRAEWTMTCKDVVTRLGGHPCIIGWVLFNESWGQFDAKEATELVRSLDGSRPILSTSGWYDQGCGDIQGIHNYFRKMHLFPDPYAKRGGRRRAQMLSEFGGYSLSIEGHTCIDRVYGYDPYTDLESWRAALDTLLGQVDALEARGLSGFVYTQLSDVEEEVNGLLTYDRRVNKFAESSPAAAPGSPSRD